MDIDLDSIDADELAAVVRTVADDEIVAMLDALGPQAAFERIFAEMQTRFRPEAAGSVDADVVFVVRHGGQEHRWLVGIRDGACTTGVGDHDAPKARLTMDSPLFIRLMTGNADGPVSFMSGKLKVQGDILFASRLLGMFEAPAG